MILEMMLYGKGTKRNSFSEIKDTGYSIACKTWENVYF